MHGCCVSPWERGCKLGRMTDEARGGWQSQRAVPYTRATNLLLHERNCIPLFKSNFFIRIKNVSLTWAGAWTERPSLERYMLEIRQGVLGAGGKRGDQKWVRVEAAAREGEASFLVKEGCSNCSNEKTLKFATWTSPPEFLADLNASTPWYRERLKRQTLEHKKWKVLLRGHLW